MHQQQNRVSDNRLLDLLRQLDATLDDLEYFDRGGDLEDITGRDIHEWFAVVSEAADLVQRIRDQEIADERRTEEIAEQLERREQQRLRESTLSDFER
jgi:hypothetical protein